jgi:hypothetical protein
MINKISGKTEEIHKLIGTIEDEIELLAKEILPNYKKILSNHGKTERVYIIILADCKKVLANYRKYLKKTKLILSVFGTVQSHYKKTDSNSIVILGNQEGILKQYEDIQLYYQKVKELCKLIKSNSKANKIITLKFTNYSRSIKNHSKHNKENIGENTNHKYHILEWFKRLNTESKEILPKSEEMLINAKDVHVHSQIFIDASNEL